MQGRNKPLTKDKAGFIHDIITERPLAIPGYDGYYIDRYGEVFNVSSGYLVTIDGYDAGGYMAIKLPDKHVVSIAKIVATLFVPNPDPQTKTKIYHLDGQYTNNNADNLLWIEPGDTRKFWAMEPEDLRTYLEELKDEAYKFAKISNP